MVNNLMQVLHMLAHSLLETPGNAAAALNMIHQIREETKNHPDDTAKPGVHLLAIKALTELDRVSDAEPELLQLASSSAPVAMLLSALQSLLTAQQQNIATSSALQQTLHLILERQQDDATVTSQVMKMLLDKVRNTSIHSPQQAQVAFSSSRLAPVAFLTGSILNLVIQTLGYYAGRPFRA